MGQWPTQSFRSGAGCACFISPSVLFLHGIRQSLGCGSRSGHYLEIKQPRLRTSSGGKRSLIHLPPGRDTQNKQCLGGNWRFVWHLYGMGHQPEIGKTESAKLVLGNANAYQPNRLCHPDFNDERDGEENKSPSLQQRAFCSDSFDPRDAEVGLYAGSGHLFG